MLVDTVYANGQSLSGTSDQVSTNVFNAGSAKKRYGGVKNEEIAVMLTAVGGTNPTFRARFVGADDAALTTNPEILDDTGASKVLAASDLPLLFVLKPALQKVAKQYYGVIFTQGGTAPTGTAVAVVAAASQSRQLQPG